MGNATVGYECVACGWVYDPAVGDPDSGIAPGTRWEDIPDDWVCPVCGAGKDAFERQERAAVAADDRPPATPPIVIVGAGLAGYTLARELRKRSAALPVLVIAADGGEVYTKPMLSNAFAKKHTPDDLVQRRPEELAAELGIIIRTRTRVTAIDRAKRRVTLDSGETVTYDQLVLAVGADPRVFPAEGSDAVGIATVNDLDSYRAWRARIAEGRRILLIGAGLIGCEFANDLAGAGYSVDVIDPSPWPLARLLPKEIGLQLAGALGSIGATVHLGRSVARYRAEGMGFVAVLDDGQEIAFDHALSAVGLRPRTALAAEAGLTVKAGIVVDRFLRTGDPAIFALGDCAESPAGPLPFIAPLLAEARVLAATLTVEPTPLVLPALPVVVKTPVLPLVVCPPPMGSDGAWEVKLGARGGEAVFRTANGTVIGFALSGTETRRQAEFTTGLPDTLPPVSGGPAKAAGGSWTCDVCGYAYDPNTGDPDNGVLPGTAWDDVPDGWECPVCGAGRDSFSKG